MMSNFITMLYLLRESAHYLESLLRQHTLLQPVPEQEETLIPAELQLSIDYPHKNTQSVLTTGIL